MHGTKRENKEKKVVLTLNDWKARAIAAEKELELLKAQIANEAAEYVETIEA